MHCDAFPPSLSLKLSHSLTLSLPPRQGCRHAPLRPGGQSPGPAEEHGPSDSLDLLVEELAKHVLGAYNSP
jgi:hypothetical protein